MVEQCWPLRRRPGLPANIIGGGPLAKRLLVYSSHGTGMALSDAKNCVQGWRWCFHNTPAE